MMMPVKGLDGQLSIQSLAAKKHFLKSEKFANAEHSWKPKLTTQNF